MESAADISSDFLRSQATPKSAPSPEPANSAKAVVGSQTMRGACAAPRLHPLLALSGQPARFGPSPRMLLEPATMTSALDQATALVANSGAAVAGEEDVLEALGKDILLFLTATVVITPLCAPPCLLPALRDSAHKPSTSWLEVVVGRSSCSHPSLAGIYLHIRQIPRPRRASARYRWC